MTPLCAAPASLQRKITTGTKSSGCPTVPGCERGRDLLFWAFDAPEWCICRARADGVDRDPILRDFLGERIREVDDCGLRRRRKRRPLGERRMPGAARPCSQYGPIVAGSCAAAPHVSRANVPRTFTAKTPSQVLVSHVSDHEVVSLPAGVVHQDVQPPQAFARSLRPLRRRVRSVRHP